MKKKQKMSQNKEEICEDWCFVCKDGGTLYVCDYKECLKAYHADCVGKSHSWFETGNLLTCTWHSCFVCKKSSNFHCFCCTHAVCKRCMVAQEFVRVKGNKGFCNYCLKLALLWEENVDVDSDGERVDFKDRDTYEGLFIEYWEIIKKNEGLTAKHLHSADAKRKMNGNYECDSQPIESEEEDETQVVSDYDDEDKPVQKRKRSNGQQFTRKRVVKSNKRDFVGWGSKSLVDFLASLGEDTSKKLSQYDVASVINEYISENKLFCPNKKKKILCDERLKSVLGRKTVNRNRIHDLLEPHFLENLEPSEEDELEFSSEDNDEKIWVTQNKQRNSSTRRKFQEKDEALDAPETCFASIVAENIRLVYLKKSLVQELLRHPETFECKVTGSFVRVKSDPSDYLQRNSHQLVQVTGVKNKAVGESSSELLLQVSNMPKDIRISMLSDDDFSEEECDELRQKVKGGLLTKPTIMELEQKARSLHEEITKHSIARELALLQNLIDRANEKGWRRELDEFLERKQLLQMPSEQIKLQQKQPTLIVEVAELEPTANAALKEYKQGDESSPKSILRGCSEFPGDVWGGSGISSVLVAKEEGRDSCVSTPERKQSNASKTSTLEELSHKSHNIIPEVGVNSVPQREPCHDISKEKQKPSKALAIECEPHPSNFPVAERNQSQQKDSGKEMSREQEATATRLIELSSSDDDDDDQNDSGKEMSRQQESSTTRLIELSSSDDDDDDDDPHHHVDSTDIMVGIGKQKLGDHDASVWHCLGPNAERKGPYSLSFLKRWSETSPFALKFKVWKAGESEKDATPLGNAICQLTT